MQLTHPKMTQTKSGAFRPRIWHWSWFWIVHPSWIPHSPAKKSGLRHRYYSSRQMHSPQDILVTDCCVYIEVTDCFFYGLCEGNFELWCIGSLAAQTSRVRVSARSRPSPPLYPHFNRPFDLASSPVSWEAATNISNNEIAHCTLKKSF